MTNAAPATSRWYALRVYNSETLYGYGTEREADQYTARLSRNREVNHYSAHPLTDDEVKGLGLESGTRSDGFDLADELASTPAPTRRWIAYLPAKEGDLNPSVGAGDTEAEAIKDGQRIVTSEQLGDPAEVYALCFDLYPYVAAVPDDIEIHTRGPEYLDGEHEAGVLVEG